MTREELLALVNKEADTTKFKSLSQKTINEELDDVLEDFGDDEAENAKLVTIDNLSAVKTYIDNNKVQAIEFSLEKPIRRNLIERRTNL